VLFHDTKRQTAAMLPAFLRFLKNGGYRVVHVVAASSAAPAPPSPPLRGLSRPTPLRPASFFFAAVCTLVWPTRNMPSTTWLGPGNTALLGPEMRPETGLDVMEMVANSSSDRRQVGRQKDRQRSSVTHGSKPLAGIDGRSARVRRFESNISDLGGEASKGHYCASHPTAELLDHQSLDASDTVPLAVVNGGAFDAIALDQRLASHCCRFSHDRSSMLGTLGRNAFGRRIDAASGNN
jgi:hypothetical protein